MSRQLFLDPCILPLVQGGGRGNGRPPCIIEACSEDDPDDVVERLQRRRDLREILIAAAGMDSFLLTLRLLFGEVSFEDIAKALGRNRGAIWRKYQAFLLRMRQTLVLADAALSAIRSGESGFTLTPEGVCVRGVDRWAVSIRGHERRFPPRRRPSFVDVAAYVAERHELLFHRAGLHLGGWTDDAGNFHLDLTRLFPGAAAARALRYARQEQQLAIVNLLDLRTSWIDQDNRERRAA